MSATAFDTLAADYDASFTHTRLGAALRALVWRRLPRVFRGCARLLELGCGTGEDAIELARRGHHVTALDASAEMIGVARAKADGAGCGDRIEFHVLPAEALGALPMSSRFDGVFSNFGVLNCVGDVGALGATLAA